MLFLDRTLKPIMKTGYKNLTLFKNDELTVWVKLRKKDDSALIGTEKSIQDLNIELTENDIQSFNDYYITDDTFFIASTKLINQLNPLDSWDYKNEKNNYANQNVVNYLIEKFGQFIIEKTPKFVLIVLSIEKEGLKPFYLYGDLSLVNLDRKETHQETKDYYDYIYEKELPKSNYIWENTDAVQNYMKKIKLYVDYFLKIAKSTNK
ncbi:hypothetical protein [Mycoplasma miroungirhinis]|uniref:Uncharacterized protein n=1 Tax=Mycoplasma miroungirhinis TaxID=754516 RepID=A0A6M4JH06_9MOLU|nr:hypothetical protein [Mycoplasma miroungirhinis]QJR44302.1 hypothetical protein HLA92_02575 [Mycoplasma miroungirhinis]